MRRLYFCRFLQATNNLKNNEKGYWNLYQNKTCYEIPIHSIDVKKIKLIASKRIFHAFNTRKYKKNKPITSEKKSIIRNIISLIKDKYSLKWDFCKQSAKEMIQFLEEAMNRYNYTDYEVPLIMIGHSKDFFNDREFDKFLKICKNKFSNEVRFIRFQTFIDNYL